MAIISILEDEDGTKLEVYMDVNNNPILKLENECETMIYIFENSLELDNLIKKLRELKSTHNG